MIEVRRVLGHTVLLDSAAACGWFLIPIWHHAQVDVTLNNSLATINTKLLTDYASIDGRLAQLVRNLLWQL